MSERDQDKFFGETFFDVDRVPSSRSREDVLLQCLMEIDSALLDRGYNSVTQLVGYLLSGDPVYITSYKGARKKILSFSREEILRFLLEKCIRKCRD